MNAGLLICDHIRPEYKKYFRDYDEKFSKLFPEFTWKLYDVVNDHFPEDLDECEVYMATGSRHSVYEDLEWIHKMLVLIQKMYEQQKYFIGFCFGHQLLGEALGGKVEKSPNGWCIGNQEFEVIEQKEWMKPVQNSFNLLMMCQDQIVQLPEHITVLASAENCPVGMIQIGETMLGIQAHPEFSKAYDKALMENRKHLMGEELVERGIKSLNEEVHSQLIHDWVLSFIKKEF